MTLDRSKLHSLTETFAGKHLFLMGSTGFLGKVCLAMLLDRFPSLGRVYVMVRAGSGTNSQERFERDVVGSPVFEPLRQRYGRALAGLINDKIRVVGGDITSDNLGYSESEAAQIAADIDIIINSSGKVTFNPALDQSLRTNVAGTKNVISFAKRMKRPCLVHVSTCFVAGNRSGAVWENEPVVGFFPRAAELEGAQFSAEKEIADCEKLARRVREESTEAVLAAELRTRARQRLRDEGRDPDNARALRLAEARERKQWVRERLTDLGIERAQRWGWPNIYCYAKSIAEQLVAAEPDLIRTIVRPSIVESAAAFPFAGWNEGFTTSAPIIFLSLKGQNVIPCSEDLILDMIPVDFVASGLLQAAAQALVATPPLVYQLCSGDTRPLRMQQMVTLLGLHKRRHFESKSTGNRLINNLIARTENQSATPSQFERSSVPMFNRLAKRASQTLEQLRPTWGGGQVSDVIDKVKQRVDRIEEVTRGVEDVFEIYRPFIAENHYCFRADNIRGLRRQLAVEEQALAPWLDADFDWHDYMLNVHFPGLHRWVLPELEKDFATRQHTRYTYNHLVELFDTTSKTHAHRVALRMKREHGEDQYTYAELQELATRAAQFLARNGVQAGHRVMLVSRNSPEWVMAYFGVMKAGAVCVPVDPQCGVDEIIKLVGSGRVKAVLTSTGIAAEAETLRRRLGAVDPDAKLWTLDRLLARPDAAEESSCRARLPDRFNSDAPASLIFTSGTTGRPKAVVLSHRNFTFMVSELASKFSVTPRDGMLSVLPLHHTFEFATGLLLPLSSGAQIAYLTELNASAITRELRAGRTTALVGVPALWEMLYRRIRSTMADGPRWLETLLHGLWQANEWLTRRSRVNFGRLLFPVVHMRFGGRIRYLFSGGSGLPDRVRRLFYGLGLPIYEGYGLTEAAPVLTVTHPDQPVLPGSVGRPLPHVEVKIKDPNAEGVGEIIARGHNIMSGYWENETATRETIRDGWLHTGDLGRLDEDNNLYLTGRRSDVIIDANGRNVYPDDLEQLYADHRLIKEVSVVGLPTGDAERVAALVVPDYTRKPAMTRESVQEAVNRHVERISGTLPPYRRPRYVHLWDAPLPRTSTGKVKRDLVVKELERLHKLQGELRRQAAQEAGSAEDERLNTNERWIRGIVANIVGRGVADIGATTRFSELGLDSLMSSELIAVIEREGGQLTSTQDASAADTVRDLARFVRAGQGRALQRRPIEARSLNGAADTKTTLSTNLPVSVTWAGRKMLNLGREITYNRVIHTKVKGKAHIPYHTNFIVAANHCSHADIGLVKTALGSAGDNVCALAASDYFFDTKLKSAFFENFTMVVPIDRSGSLRRSLQQAIDLLHQGYSLLIFPEGTRSMDGVMREFKASVGYLAMNGECGILPMHLSGTRDVLPKGSWMIQSRQLTASIGALLSVEDQKALVADVPRAGRYRCVAAATQRLVEALRDGQARPSLDELRAGWANEAQRVRQVG